MRKTFAGSAAPNGQLANMTSETSHVVTARTLRRGVWDCLAGGGALVMERASTTFDVGKYIANRRYP